MMFTCPMCGNKYDPNVSYNHKQEHTMTREEAESKVYGAMYGVEKRKEFLDGLEALGLIKFDEPIETILIGDIHGTNHKIKMKMIIATLQARGYKIVKEQS